MGAQPIMLNVFRVASNMSKKLALSINIDTFFLSHFIERSQIATENWFMVTVICKDTTKKTI